MEIKEDKGRKSGGVGFFGLLGLLFIGLKLAGLIDWEWWVVLSPLWGSFAIQFAVLFVAYLAIYAKGD